MWRSGCARRRQPDERPAGRRANRRRGVAPAGERTRQECPSHARRAAGRRGWNRTTKPTPALLGSVLEELGIRTAWCAMAAGATTDAADDPPRSRLSPKHFERVAERALAELPEACGSAGQRRRAGRRPSDGTAGARRRGSAPARTVQRHQHANQSTLGGRRTHGHHPLPAQPGSRADDDAELAEQIRITVITRRPTTSASATTTWSGSAWAERTRRAGGVR